MDKYIEGFLHAYGNGYDTIDINTDEAISPLEIMEYIIRSWPSMSFEKRLKLANHIIEGR